MSLLKFQCDTYTKFKMFFTIFFIFILTGLAVGEEALRNGANDIIVVHRSDGGFVSTRWDVKFGKLHSLLISREGKEVYIFVNNVPARQRMEIQDSGYAAFKGSSDKYMTSHHLEELNLKPGLNKGKFVAPQLGVVIPFNVFLYEENDKIVFTDIDGTITQSDIKGHVMPHFGLTAEHPAVVELFSRIKEQGYHVIYLTSRSISQDAETKEYLFEMLQNLYL
ncbi:nuclear elongation and deformation protein 1-like isoform X1 [Eurytemora carolleeae]|uniref:nuclear elongation and deformation protein 1-like isoform X1 n=1 Tax=Eurytemora carolleeae TaxID=1294199 RepID=UPI000C782293|nr:nuclear elongation and deformation protein 1-like isoform X1 [Eurytemora carolleeae]|eukprot:XP_023337550.1 nuclear elongation and deformation protein 1-like isoform X1 [Eurytemora affinis]